MAYIYSNLDSSKGLMGTVSLKMVRKERFKDWKRVKVHSQVSLPSLPCSYSPHDHILSISRPLHPPSIVFVKFSRQVYQVNPPAVLPFKYLFRLIQRDYNLSSPLLSPFFLSYLPPLTILAHSV